MRRVSTKIKEDAQGNLSVNYNYLLIEIKWTIIPNGALRIATSAFQSSPGWWASHKDSNISVSLKNLVTIPSNSAFWWWFSGAQGAGSLLFIILRASKWDHSTQCPKLHCPSKVSFWFLSWLKLWKSWVLSVSHLEQWDFKALCLWQMYWPQCNETLSISSLELLETFFPHTQSACKPEVMGVYVCVGGRENLELVKDFVTMLWFGINSVGRSFPGGSQETQRPSL